MPRTVPQPTKHVSRKKPATSKVRQRVEKPVILTRPSQTEDIDASYRKYKMSLKYNTKDLVTTAVIAALVAYAVTRFAFGV